MFGFIELKTMGLLTACCRGKLQDEKNQEANLTNESKNERRWPYSLGLFWVYSLLDWGEIALTGVDKEKVTSNSKLLILSDFELKRMERVMGVEPTTFTLAT